MLFALAELWLQVVTAYGIAIHWNHTRVLKQCTHILLHVGVPPTLSTVLKQCTHMYLLSISVGQPGA